MVSRSVLGLGLLALLVTPGIVSAQDTYRAAQGPFRLEFREVDNHRGPVIEGSFYNGLPARIGDVRIRIDSIDTDGCVVGQSYGWVVGDAAAGGDVFFVVPLSIHGASYRASVESFDEIDFETPGSDAATPESGAAR